MKCRIQVITALLLLTMASLAAAPRISLLTFYPGSIFFELEGHSALRIVYDDGRDYTYNWGTFDFNSPNFVYRFVSGQTDYMLEGAPTDLFIDHYRSSGRRVVEQPLLLDSIQADRLSGLVAENMQPANRVYRYNYVLDNCATRPLAMIEKAVGDTLALGEPTNPDLATFREVMRRYHRNYPWYQFGIDLALGSTIDRPLAPRRRAFAPVDLMTMLDGNPIAGEPVVIVDNDPEGAVLGPTSWYFTPMAVGCLVLLATFIVCVGDMRRRRISRWFHSFVYTIFMLAGLVLTFLIFVSVHYATSPNWLYLWLNPLCFIGAVLIWFKSAKKAVYWWQFLNFALLLALCGLAAAGVQSLNAAFWPLIIADMLLSATYIYVYRNDRRITS